MGLGGASALAQSPSPSSAVTAPALLDVPYLSQSVLLCGGAALAMVERWWGRRGVYGEDFAALVRPELGGILTTQLDSAARARGWDTRVMDGTPELVRQHLEAGEPVVALIQVAPRRFHYVVVLRWREGKVTFHDPARSPFITLDEAGFLTRWNGGERWAMVIRPAETPAAPAAGSSPTVVPPPVDFLPCRPWLDRAVDAAVAGRLDEAFGMLEQAGTHCPGEPLVLREMAGVRFRQGRHADAVRLAEDYLARAPEDHAGWQLLASARYLTGDRDGALAAWNRLGRPTVDLLRIDGAEEVRFRGIAAAASVPAGTVLTPERMALARRRVSDVPALRLAAVEYQPVPGGLVEVRIAVVERAMVDPAWRLALTGGVRALSQSEATLDVASPTGGGEVWNASGRWGSGRPRAALQVDAPVHLFFPGVIGVEGSWERFHAPTFEETRRTAFVGFGGWVTAGIRPSAGIRLEKWSEQRDYLALSLGAELRAAGDRLALSATGARAVALSAQRSYTRAGARAIWASTPGLSRAAWSVRAGVEWSGSRAPFGAWPVAGSAVAWAIPLRAHSLDEDELLVGRTVAHGGLAGDHPVARMGPLLFAAGAFLDAARVSGVAGGSGGRWYLDGGLGMRIGIAEGRLGVIRVDLARGWVGGRRTTLSAGVHRTWPLY